MEIARQASGTVARCLLAGLIALAASGCTALNADSAGGQQATNGAGQARADADPTQATAQDPVKQIGDILEERVRIMVAAAHSEPTH
jgi:hypothetical protein